MNTQQQERAFDAQEAAALANTLFQRYVLNSLNKSHGRQFYSLPGLLGILDQGEAETPRFVANAEIREQNIVAFSQELLRAFVLELERNHYGKHGKRTACTFYKKIETFFEKSDVFSQLPFYLFALYHVALTHYHLPDRVGNDDPFVRFLGNIRVEFFDTSTGNFTPKTDLAAYNSYRELLCPSLPEGYDRKHIISQFQCFDVHPITEAAKARIKQVNIKSVTQYEDTLLFLTADNCGNLASVVLSGKDPRFFHDAFHPEKREIVQAKGGLSSEKDFLTVIAQDGFCLSVVTKESENANTSLLNLVSNSKTDKILSAEIIPAYHPQLNNEQTEYLCFIALHQESLGKESARLIAIRKDTLKSEDILRWDINYDRAACPVAELFLYDNDRFLYADTEGRIAAIDAKTKKGVSVLRKPSQREHCTVVMLDQPTFVWIEQTEHGSFLSIAEIKTDVINEWLSKGKPKEDKREGLFYRSAHNVFKQVTALVSTDKNCVVITKEDATCQVWSLSNSKSIPKAIGTFHLKAPASNLAYQDKSDELFLVVNNEVLRFKEVTSPGVDCVAESCCRLESFQSTQLCRLSLPEIGDHKRPSRLASMFRRPSRASLTPASPAHARTNGRRSPVRRMASLQHVSAEPSEVPAEPTEVPQALLVAEPVVEELPPPPPPEPIETMVAAGQYLYVLTRNNQGNVAMIDPRKPYARANPYLNITPTNIVAMTSICNNSGNYLIMMSDNGKLLTLMHLNSGKKQSWEWLQNVDGSKISLSAISMENEAGESDCYVTVHQATNMNAAQEKSIFKIALNSFKIELVHLSEEQTHHAYRIIQLLPYDNRCILFTNELGQLHALHLQELRTELLLAQPGIMSNAAVIRINKGNNQCTQLLVGQNSKNVLVHVNLTLMLPPPVKSKVLGFLNNALNNGVALIEGDIAKKAIQTGNQRYQPISAITSCEGALYFVTMDNQLHRIGYNFRASAGIHSSCSSMQLPEGEMIPALTLSPDDVHVIYPSDHVLFEVSSNMNDAASRLIEVPSYDAVMSPNYEPPQPPDRSDTAIIPRMNNATE